MTYTIVWFHPSTGLAPFMSQENAEDSLREAAERAGLTVYEIAPLAHRSRKLVLRDRAGNLIALAATARSPL